MLQKAALWALLAAMGPSCAQQAPAGTEPPAFGAAHPRHSAEEVWLGIPGEPSTLDPARCSESTCGHVVGNLFASLVTFADERLTITGELAESWQHSADHRRFRFVLRNTKWSDGTPVSARDVVDSVLRVLAPKTASPSAHLLYVIEKAEAYSRGQAKRAAVGVVALDGRTVEFRLREPAPWFLQLAVHSVLRPVPSHVPAQSGDPALWPRPQALVTSGAYKVARWRFRRDADFSRNPYSWRCRSLSTKQIRAVVLPNADAGMALYEYGALDLLGTRVPMAWMPRVQHAPDFHSLRLLSSNYYWLNTKRPPLDDVRVRRALSLAIDRDALVQGILQGQGEAAATLVPPALLPSASARAFDPELAKTLLKEASADGKSVSRRLVLSFNSDETHRRLAEAIQAMWKDTLGILVELRQQEWRVYLQDLMSHDFDIARLGWIADYADAHSYLDGIFAQRAGNNLSGWSDPLFDDDIQKSLQEPDEGKRIALLARAQARMLSAQPLIMLTFGQEATLVKPYVKGYVSNPLAHLDWHRLHIDLQRAAL